VDNTPGDKLGVWRDMRLADALVIIIIIGATPALADDSG